MAWLIAFILFLASLFAPHEEPQCYLPEGCPGPTPIIVESP